MDRIEQIVKDAEQRLKAFYSSYGEWDGKKEKVLKKNIENPEEIDLVEEKDTENYFFKDGPVSKPKIINRIDTPKQEIIEEEKVFFTLKEIEEPGFNFAVDPSGVKISFKGLSSREIIDKILYLTGEHIQICVKSKKNVIRHAINILKEKGFTIT